jgi:membrane protein YqaA with SNARE-associated domain
MILALAGLFMWSFLAATILPLSSEVPLVVYVRSYNQFLLPVAVATIGNYLGSCTTYWLARRAAMHFDKTRELAESDRRAARLLRRFGQPTLVLSWVPIVGDAVVALAGASGVPFTRFSFWVVLGKVARYAAVAWTVIAI